MKDQETKRLTFAYFGVFDFGIGMSSVILMRSKKSSYDAKEHLNLLSYFYFRNNKIGTFN